MGHFVVSAAVNVRVGKNIKQPAGRNANTTTALDIACSLRAKRRPAKAARREAPLYLILRSGRLDVCKSGVCGAGLNRNME